MAVTHLAATLLQSYVEEGIPVNTDPPWSIKTLDEAIHNDTTDREIAPESMQFGKAFPRILQAIWEADPAEGPVRLPNLT